MAHALNKVQLIGYVGQDAEIRQAGNTQVATCSVATSESWKNKQTGQWESRSEWHNLVVWADAAESFAKVAKKGARLYIEGKLQTRDWVDPQGVKKYKTEIVVREWVDLRDKAERQAGRGGDPGPDESNYRNSRHGQRSGGGGYGGGGQGNGYQADAPAYDDFDVGDLGPPLDMDDDTFKVG